MHEKMHPKDPLWPLENSPLENCQQEGGFGYERVVMLIGFHVDFAGPLFFGGVRLGWKNDKG